MKPLNFELGFVTKLGKKNRLKLMQLDTIRNHNSNMLWYQLLDYEFKINHKKHQIIDIIYYCNIKSSS